MNRFMLHCYIVTLCHLSTLPSRKFYLKKNDLALSPLYPLMSLLQPHINDLVMSPLSANIVSFVVISLLTVLLLGTCIVTSEVTSWTTFQLVHPTLLVTHTNPNLLQKLVLNLLMMLPPHLISLHLRTFS